MHKLTVQSPNSRFVWLIPCHNTKFFYSILM